MVRIMGTRGPKARPDLKALLVRKVLKEIQEQMESMVPTEAMAHLVIRGKLVPRVTWGRKGPRVRRVPLERVYRKTTSTTA